MSRIATVDPNRAQRRALATLVLAPAFAIGTAAALIPVRDQIDNGAVALALGLVVVCSGAVGGRRAATVTSITAALAFDVWHTSPYMSFKIDNTTDVLATVLLIVLGVVSGRVAEHSWGLFEREQLRVDQLDHLHRIAELAIAAEGAAAVWPTIRDTLCRELHLVACWFEPLPEGGFGSDIEFAELTHSGNISPRRSTMKWSPTGFELPRNGIELSITGGGHQLGRLILLPEPGYGMSIVDRCFAVAVADQFSLVAVRDDRLTPLS